MDGLVSRCNHVLGNVQSSFCGLKPNDKAVSNWNWIQKNLITEKCNFTNYCTSVLCKWDGIVQETSWLS